MLEHGVHRVKQLDRDNDQRLFGRFALGLLAEINGAPLATTAHGAEGAARGGGVTLQPLPIKSPNEIPGTIAEAARQRAGALLVLTSPLIFTSLRPIAEAAIKHRLPAINLFVPFFAEAGGLLAYGPDFRDLFRSAAGYVDRILKGAKPADLPVQRPTKFEFIINLKTAKALGLTIPYGSVQRSTVPSVKSFTLPDTLPAVLLAQPWGLSTPRTTSTSRPTGRSSPAPPSSSPSWRSTTSGTDCAMRSTRGRFSDTSPVFGHRES